MQRSDILALLGSLGITGLLLWGLVYFVNEWWARLPKAVALTVCILLAVMVIGYPIYALARWSDRYLERARAAKAQGERKD
ncbi:MAG: hypothetical protein ABTR27_11315 [Candidatus Competibacter phosphatis]